MSGLHAAKEKLISNFVAPFFLKSQFLPDNIPFASVVFGIEQAITHLVHFFFFFGMEIGLLLVNPDTVIFPGKVNDQGIKGWLNIMQPLPVFFFYKSLAHCLCIELKKVCLLFSGMLFVPQQWPNVFILN
jgi:hypothetical protein